MTNLHRLHQLIKIQLIDLGVLNALFGGENYSFRNFFLKNLVLEFHAAVAIMSFGTSWSLIHPPTNVSQE